MQGAGWAPIGFDPCLRALRDQGHVVGVAFARAGGAFAGVGPNALAA